MAFSSEINIMDMFFNSNDPFSQLEDPCSIRKDDPEDDMEWLSDDFIDSILKTKSESDLNLFESNNSSFGNNLVSPNNSFVESSSSDSGMSSDVFSSCKNKIQEECEFTPQKQYTDIILETTNADSLRSNDKDTGTEENDESSVTLPDTIKEELIECEEVSLLNSDNLIATQIPIIDGYNEIGNSNDGIIFVSSDMASDDECLQRPIIKQKKMVNLNLRRNTILLQNSVAGFRNLKLLSKQNRYRNSFKLNRGRVKEDILSTDDGASDDSDMVYPKLRLTAEEKKLMIKEGIVLPSHYPLTKQEEKDLKRIRRKIRNKISAQDSRRRKKEYVDGLEERVKRCSEENVKLMKCIKQLQTQNVSLVNQVRKLQASLGKTVATPVQNNAQSSTCLLVLFLSLALVLAPVLRNSPIKPNTTDDEGISLSDVENTVSSGQSRNLLFTKPELKDGICSVDEENKIIPEEVKLLEFPKQEAISSLNEWLSFGEKTDVGLKDHDYFRPRKRPASSISSDSDDAWPTPPHSPSKAFCSGNFVRTVEIDPDIFHKNNKMNHTEHPIIIDLLD